MWLVFLGFACLASAISVNKVILSVLPPIFFVGLRTLCAGILLVGYNFRNNPRLSWKHLKHDFIVLLGVSLFTTFIPSILKAYALQNLISSKAAFLGSLDPFVTVIYAYILWHEKISLQKIIGIIVGFIGTMILLVPTSAVEQSLIAWWIFSYPELAALLAMALGRLGWMLVQILLRKERYSPSEVNGITMFGSGIFALTTAAATETIPPMSTLMQPWLMLLLIYTIIVGNVIAYTMYANFLRYYTSTFVSLAGFSVPLFVYIYGWIFLSEPLSLNFVISAIITFFGLLIFYQSELKKGIAK